MTQALEKKLDDGRIIIDLPMKEWSVLSHVANIDYGIRRLKRHHNSVIGYFLVSGWGTRESLHQIVPRRIAETMKR